MLAIFSPESIFGGMSVNQEVRNNTKELLKGAPGNIPQPFGLDTYEEVQAFLKELKPLQYVALARVISPIVARVTAHTIERVENFDELYSQMYNLFSEAIEKEKGSDAYEEAAQYPRIIGVLDPSRYGDLEPQLWGGVGTATSTMLGVLERLPDILAHHKPERVLDTETLENVARNSGRLIWRHAMMSTDQMMAVRDIMPYNWFEEEDKDLFGERLDEFVVMSDSDGNIQSVDFEDLGSLVLPKGFVHRGDNPLEHDTLLKDFVLHDRPIIGCPITLLSASMKQLWQWNVDAVVQSHLWEN